MRAKFIRRGISVKGILKLLRYLTPIRLGYIMLILSVLVISFGFFEKIAGQTEGLLSKFIQDFYANIETDLLFTSITILLIDRLNKQQDEKNEKEDLWLQMDSPDNSFAREAVRKLNRRNWLDEAIQRADLKGANLSNEDFSYKDFRQARITKAKFDGCNLNGSKFIGVDLSITAQHRLIRQRFEPV